MLKDHQHSTATGDNKDYSSQYSGNGNMGRTWKVEVDRRLRSRQASDQVLDWETLWKVLFPEDIDIPSGGKASLMITYIDSALREAMVAN